jgi:diguanylate cyclase (GGDEF)-like protein
LLGRSKLVNKIKNTVFAMDFAHWLVILLSLALTTFAWWYASEQVESKSQEHFQRQTRQVVDLVIDRMQKYEDALWGGVAYVHANDNSVPYSNWEKYVKSLNIVNKYPGINGIGIIFNVSSKNELPVFLDEMRKSRSEFINHPQHNRERYLPIGYINPVIGNEKAVGLDMAFEDNRYNAALKAESTGKSQLTGPIILVQDKEKTPGFLLFTPYYSKDSFDEKSRKENFLGMVYAPFIMKKLISGTLAQENRDVSIKIHDDGDVLFNELVESNSGYDPNSEYKKQKEIEIYGRTWTFDLQSSTSFKKATSNNQPLIILVCGIIIDILLIMLFVHITNAKRKAIGYAQTLNKDIEDKSRALSILNKRLELALSASHVGVWEYDLNSKTMIWDKAMFSLYEISSSELQIDSNEWEKRIHPQDRDDVLNKLYDAVNTNSKFDTSFRLLLPDNKVKVIRVLADVIKQEHGNVKVIGVNWEITDIKNKEAQLEYLANYDSLSHLKNRFSFNEYFNKIISHASNNNLQFALMLVDIDNFKQINDTYGHKFGDEYISEFSEVLASICRNRDIVFRLGGDEFAIITDYFSDSSIPADIADRIVETMNEPIIVGDYEFKETVGIGIGVFPYAGVTTDELMTNADLALYKSKEEGKGCINFFTESLNEKAKMSRYIKSNILAALEKGEIYMNYQAIVDANTMKAVAFEALARWKSDIGFIPPDKFVAIAEKSNIIHTLGDSIANMVAKDISNYSDNIKCSINCSSRQLVENKDFTATILKTIADNGMSPSRVILEVTETYLIRDYDTIRTSLDELHSHGIDIAIDDFGTGYSSLSLLANIEFQYLKIDRAFVQNLDSPTGLNVMQCIFNVAQSLGKQVIAEGIETKEQMDILLDMGVTLMQGYYFARPSDIKDIKVDFST